MSKQQAFNSSFERSEQLKQEWSHLRSEMQAIPTDDPMQSERRQQIHQRMDRIMQEMTDVLSKTRQLFPTMRGSPTHQNPQPHSNSPLSDTTLDDDFSPTQFSLSKTPPPPPPPPPTSSSSTTSHKSDTQQHSTEASFRDSPTHRDPARDDSLTNTGRVSPTNRVQYSARRKHVVRRTYDSTSSSSSEDVDAREEDSDDADECEALRRQMKHAVTHANPDSPIITVEHKSHLPNFSSITRGIRNKLRSATSPANATTTTAPQSSTTTATMSSAESVNSDLVPNSASKGASPAESDGIATPSSAPAAPTPPGSLPDEDQDDLDDLSIPVVLFTDADREALSIEQSKLERESRRLKRKPDRTPLDETRLQDIASRLSKLSSTLAEAADGSEPSVRGRPLMSPRNALPVLPLSRLEKNRETLVSTSHVPPTKSTPNAGNNPSKKFSNNIFGARSMRGQTATSPVTADDDDGNDIGIDGTEEEQSPATAMRSAGSKTISKRKKTWMAFEVGMAPLKALGRSVRNTTLPPTAKTPTRGRRATTTLGMSSSSSIRPNESQRSHHSNQSPANGSTYAELSNRIADRREKLATTADASERMANDTADMLSAAKALRQKQQKGLRS